MHWFVPDNESLSQCRISSKERKHAENSGSRRGCIPNHSLLPRHAHYAEQQFTTATEHALVQNRVVWDSARAAAGRFGAGGGSHSRSGASGRHFVLPERERGGESEWISFITASIVFLGFFSPPLNISLKSLWKFTAIFNPRCGV